MDRSEVLPEPRVEETVLATLGYKYALDTVVDVDKGVHGRNFLDAYGDSPHRQNTEYILSAFRDMSLDDPDYQETKNYILSYLEVMFGPPILETESSV